MLLTSFLCLIWIEDIEADRLLVILLVYRLFSTIKEIKIGWRLRLRCWLLIKTKVYKVNWRLIEWLWLAGLLWQVVLLNRNVDFFSYLLLFVSQLCLKLLNLFKRDVFSVRERSCERLLGKLSIFYFNSSWREFDLKKQRSPFLETFYYTRNVRTFPWVWSQEPPY